MTDSTIILSNYNQKNNVALIYLTPQFNLYEKQNPSLDKSFFLVFLMCRYDFRYVGRGCQLEIR